MAFEARNYPEAISLEQLQGRDCRAERRSPREWRDHPAPLARAYPGEGAAEGGASVEGCRGDASSSIGNIVYNDLTLGPAPLLRRWRSWKTLPLKMEGLDARVIGHSEIVGKPIAFLMMGLGATVTVCHHMTRQVAVHSRAADAVSVCRGGQAGAGDRQYAQTRGGADRHRHQPGRWQDGGRRRFASCAEVAGWITPVPGGGAGDGGHPDEERRVGDPDADGTLPRGLCGGGLEEDDMTAVVIDGKAFAAKVRAQVAAMAAVKSRGCSPVWRLCWWAKTRPARSMSATSTPRPSKSAWRRSNIACLPTLLGGRSAGAGALAERRSDGAWHSGATAAAGASEFELIINTIDPAKDVDGFHISNVGLLGTGQKSMVPCTPLGCLMMLRDHHGKLAGLNAVVVGRSNIVGKPMAQLLLGDSCTVTIAHSRTKDLAAVCRGADILRLPLAALR